MGSRVPLRGYNHNMRYKNRVFHVQTEDSGLDNPHVFTHIFIEGQIISSSRTEYADLVDDPDNEKKVRKMMQQQHKTLMKRLRGGDFDDKIIQLMGVLEPEAGVEVPAGMEAPAAPEPAAASAEPATPSEPGPVEEAPATAEPATIDAAETPAEPDSVEKTPAAVEPEPAEVIPAVTQKIPASVLQTEPSEDIPDTDKMPAVAEVASVPEIAPSEARPDTPSDTIEAPSLQQVATDETALDRRDTDESTTTPARVAAQPPPVPVAAPSTPKATRPPPPPPESLEPRPLPVAIATPVSLEDEVTEAIDIRALRDRRKPPALPVEVATKTQAIDMRHLHGFDRHAQTSADLPLFPPEEEVSVIVDGPPDDAASTTYSQVYRKSNSGVPPTSRRRIETPLPGRGRPSPKQPPMRRQSRVFEQPLPGSTRYPSSDELPSVGAMPRKSGVYLVPGGPPQRPPHPDPAVRHGVVADQERTVSSPQRYTAPSRGAVQKARPVTRPKRQTGSYEVPVSTAPTGAPTAARRDSGTPARGSAPVSAGTPPPRPTGPRPSRARARSRPPTAPQTSAGRARPPSRQQVVARPVVVVGQPVNVGGKQPVSVPGKRPGSVPGKRPDSVPGKRPVNVGGKPAGQETRAPTPPAVTPKSTPRARRPSKPREPASVFGSDLISERSLDEVILSYLAEDSEGEEEE